jgi:putative copper export protein/methionine-rich copper-binding protein CopC
VRTTWSREGWRARLEALSIVPLVALMALMALMATAALPAPAWAHGRLTRAVPAEGSRSSVAPRELRLEFSEQPALAVSTVRLLASGGREIPLGALGYAADSRRALVAPVATVLAPGAYTVVWQMAGDDGHPVRGRYGFTVDPAAGAREAPVTPEAPRQVPTRALPGDDFGVSSPAYVAIRWLQYLGLLLAIGAVALRHIVLRVARDGRDLGAGVEPFGEPSFGEATLRAAARAGALAAGLLAATTLARLYAQSRAMHGAAAAFDAGLLSSMLGRTAWGWGWLLEAAALLGAAAGFALAQRAPRTPAYWRTAAVAVLALALVPALSGHAMAAPRFRTLTVAGDTVHVLAAGAWLGTLALLALVAIPESMRTPVPRRAEALALLVRAFTPIALGCAALLALTGALAAWVHLGGVAELWTSRYGRTLLVKLALVALVMLAGGYNWRRAAPALGGEGGVERLRRSARVELLLGALVLLLTAVLVATPSAVEALGGAGM